MADGYLSLIHGSAYDFALNTKGRILIENGGYHQKIIDDEEEKELAKAQVQSVIDTNSISKRVAITSTIILLFSTTLQINTCQRDIHKDRQEDERYKREQISNNQNILKRNRNN